MKIYIAAPYALRPQAIEIMTALEERGITVTSRWCREGFEVVCHENAVKDLEDVAAADVLLAINLPGWENAGTGGRHVEFGYALALGKGMMILGVRSNIFHYLHHVAVFETLGEVLEALECLQH